MEENTKTDARDDASEQSVVYDFRAGETLRDAFKNTGQQDAYDDWLKSPQADILRRELRRQPASANGEDVAPQVSVVPLNVILPKALTNSYASVEENEVPENIKEFVFAYYAYEAMRENEDHLTEHPLDLLKTAVALREALAENPVIPMAFADGAIFGAAFFCADHMMWALDTDNENASTAERWSNCKFIAHYLLHEYAEHLEYLAEEDDFFGDEITRFRNEEWIAMRVIFDQGVSA